MFTNLNYFFYRSESSKSSFRIENNIFYIKNLLHITRNNSLHTHWHSDLNIFRATYIVILISVVAAHAAPTSTPTSAPTFTSTAALAAQARRRRVVSLRTLAFDATVLRFAVAMVTIGICERRAVVGI